VDVPVMMVGGLRTFDLMEDVVRKGEADFISLSRPLIKEPGIINSWKDREYRKPACISCNKCYEALIEGKRLHCVMSGNKGE
jgi:2,4-dienoyl-CoA reductase-like NADH-dependent reductase (Old Yellow Enzyme family)